MNRRKIIERLERGLKCKKIKSFKKCKSNNYDIIVLITELAISRIQPYLFY